MARKNQNQQLSALAMRVLADHERAPEASFYDLLTLGRFFDSGAIAQLDAAYSDLENAGLVERVDGETVRFGGQARPKFRLRSVQSEKRRRRSA